VISEEFEFGDHTDNLAYFNKLSADIYIGYDVSYKKILTLTAMKSTGNYLFIF